MRLGNGVLIAGLVGVVWWAWSTRPIPHPPGVLVPETPTQTDLPDAQPGFSKAGYKITPLARFEVHARVLSTEHYYLGRESDLSPVDFALGWGRLSDTQYIEKLGISQSMRFYFYHWFGDPPLPPGEIVSSSANMHLIPADRLVAHKLGEVRKGHIVRLSGYLVRAEAADGWRWVSSLSRTDTGAGACEVVWVESVDITPD